MTIRLLLTVLLGFGLAACQHTPPETVAGQFCDIQRFSLEQPLPGEPRFMDMMKAADGDMLFLSGGSENGAFGAGFFSGWKVNGRPPEFSLVTGISTGGLQATGAFIQRPDITAMGYMIDSEADLLETYVSGSDVRGGLSTSAAITALRRGAIADLVPLRARLHTLFTPDVLEEVARRYDESPPDDRKRLLVGATDVDLGRAVAFDMTELASRYAAKAPASAERARLKNCYVEALVASSIVPPGARPVFIDNRMYIDGGVRYAVFDDRIGELLANTGPAALESTGMPRIYIILNGDGETRAECGKVDAANCDPPSSTAGKHKDWDLLSLGFRSLSLLTDQVRRLSIARAASRSADRDAEIRFARIRAEDLDDPAQRVELPGFSGARTCAEWRGVDMELDDPVEFHARYMRCLIIYGRMRGAALDWDQSG
ncbi:patatin-like phospholipase family protein [Pacificimonas sp. WHA3]|uniref:Patatin-like phospholipase family protein n=1 Tax=Pacificimonas pallii TaxID=2827236 RepID=A0ABS6SB17_9SPHN|nr:patatin-like phospholipase family protein [Pacificimonas pallii]MBV7255599.1 patatin-like phospholipase family protein [Pacificimonas pallii]